MTTDRLKNVELLPIWKKNATNAERFRELAPLAEKNPEKFDKWVLIYCEDNAERFKIRFEQGDNTRTSDCFGVLSAGAQHIFEVTRKDKT